MNRLLRVLLGMVCVFSVGLTQAAPKPGAMAPDFTATDTQGNTVTLSRLQGQYVVLEWTNHLCPFVQKHYGSGNMQALQKTYTDKGYHWYSIVSSAPGKQGNIDAAKANELTTSRGAAPSGVILDPSGAIGKLYDARTTPHMFIIDPSGKLVYMGGIDSIPSADKADLAAATNYVKAAFTELEAGKPVSTPVSAPYGCSVKY
ncbi:redoxin domain-containing protein [Ketobacter sp.]|uniref:redoxin domain-containing protein n=1 Tax=Ketobacter sp. TaxID=2083498 RepID=UPI000F25D3C5|nr:redoxin domain-containing protein [Ketobacter sp.]RLT99268.1 MAG: thioredoxin family protein [Ketobacter sp.]